MHINLRSHVGVEIEYYPATLKTNPSGWLIEYYALNPFTNSLERQTIKVNKFRKKIGSDAQAKKELKVQCNILNYKLANGWTPFVDCNIRDFSTITQTIDKFMELKQSELREESLRSYRSYIKIFKEWLVYERLDKKLPSDIEHSHCVKYLDYIKLQRNLSNTSWNNYKSFMVTLWSWLIERGFCSKNHFSAIKSKKSEKKRRKIIPIEVRQKITNYLKDNEYSFYVFILFEYACLMRPAEIFRMKICNIDLQKQIISLDGEQTKNGEPRDIVIPNSIINELIKYFDFINADLFDKECYLFSSGFLPNNKLMRTKEAGSKWIKMREHLNLPKEYQLYSLRDTSIIDMLLSNIPAKAVQSHADHHDLSITSIYANHVNSQIIDEIKNNTPNFS